MTGVRLGGHAVGPGHPPFVVAEMSGNHGGDLGRALAIVDAVADSGAHALKLQTYRPDTITLDVERPEFRVDNPDSPWHGQHLHTLYERAHTPWEWHAPLFERARRRGLVAFSSPFDPTAVELLESLDTAAYKIASSELVDLPLIERCARTGRPLVLSTGKATPAEIDAAVRTARDAGNDDLVVLGCTASYPAPVRESNVLALPTLARAFGTAVGLSDHTPGIGAAVAAVAHGASLIEKHVTLDRADGAVDSAFSLEPAELAALVTECARAWEALGEPTLGPRPSERAGVRLRRSLYVVADVQAGEPVTERSVRSVRPAGGLLPSELPTVLGRPFRAAATRGTPLTWDLL
ncbi:pseudaminic acid synthase [Saccharomonospora saliphila]|uniref:pseudaminic acid synthase n=1 Tax=Saccharomonospora saliphila TaxID=369829 RepID=UPI00035DEEB8|nr:pseudaminic acid synthase [Saccharomonospora saliphila]